MKKWVRADEFSDDDEILEQLTEAAETFVIQKTNRTYDELVLMFEDGKGFPKPLQQAVLMLVAHWYNQPEAVASTPSNEVAYSLQALITPYRRLV